MARMHLASGSIIGGKYRVERVVGEGGMGVVCVGTHLALGHRVAIKVLAAGALGHEQATARFEREARVSASLAHENVVRVFDFGSTEEGSPFLVMEFLDGEDLAARLEREGPLPVREALELFAQACEGLAEAHAQGLVHRDLKPSNLFLARRATGAIVLKVIDFGIAKESALGGGHAMTRTNDVIGSPQYMSPEQIRDAKNLDARTDIWSLGASLYEALAGVPVFEAESLTDLLVKIATAPVPSLKARRAEVPAEVEEVLARCLERDPAARFASMTELRAALHALSEGPPARRASIGETALGSAATVNATAEGEGGAREAQGAFAAARLGSRARRWPSLVAVAVAVAIAGAAVLARHRAGGDDPSRAGKTEAIESRAARAAATAILDEAPPTTNEVARLAYAEGIQAYRDAARFRFLAAMDRACAADPALAIAHLLAALERNPFDGAGAREHLRRARAHRASLSRPADALLDAAEAYVQPTWDLAGFERRLVHATEAFPGETLLVEWRGMARQLQGFSAEAAADQAEASRLDALRSTPQWRQGQALLLAGRRAEALGAWSRCLEVNPHAIGCRDNRARLALAPEGRCAEVEADLRALMAEEPSVSRYPEALASTLAARGEPVMPLVELLAKRLPLLDGEARAPASLDDRSALALLDGDVGSAIRFAQERVALAHGAIDEQVAALRRLAALLVEAGDAPAASRVVRAFLERKDGLPGAHTPLDRSASLRIFVRDAGGMTEASFRSAWDADAPFWDAPSTMRPRADGVRPQSMDLWVEGYAAAARDRWEAEEALALEPRFASFHPQASVLDFYARGRVKLLAGRLEDARADLERAAHHCDALGSVERVRARALLGDVYAAAGKSEAACDEYAAVLAAWGHAKPRSVTAEAAREAAARLSCPKRP
jgi:tetratricopeptide (TPR) repeat protein